MERLLPSESNQPEIGRLLRVAWTARIRIVITVAAVTTLAAAVNFLMPNSYRSSGTLLPTGQQTVSSALGNLAAAVPNLDLLKSDPEPTGSSQLFPDMLRSDAIRCRVLDTELPPALAQRLDAQTTGGVFSEARSQQLRSLSAATSIGKDKNTGVISVSFEWTDAEFAQFVAAEYLRQLDLFCSSERFARLDEQRRFVESRLADAEIRLRAAEDSLLLFREQNRNYYVSGSPEMQLEHERRVRVVSEIGQVCGLLKQQLELTTIEAKRKKPVVAVLDWPRIPDEKSGPHRVINIIQFSLAALLLTLAVIVGRDFLRRQLSEQQVIELRQLRSELKREVSGIRGRLRLRRKAEA